MLPYSPLHHLLLADAGVPLVLTSGNVSDEPIAYRDEDACERLGALADVILTHDRPIETRTDDSVLRVLDTGAGRRAAMLRRSRGYVPASLALPGAGAHRPLLACGAELKSTFCLAREGRAWVSHHIGDLHNAETLASFQAGVDHFIRLFEVTPEVVAHDLHPEYLSTKYAHELQDAELIGGAAPPRPSGRLPGRARRGGPGCWCHLRRHRPGPGRHRVGRGDPGRRLAAGSSAWARFVPFACLAVSGRSASPGGWPAPG